jgi:beta-1,4-mannosyl-glycoprotein beta-1,4-N-acetylglucosaminyltransferase
VEKGIFKMIDAFPFCHELDVLEVRLHALAPYVNRFILAECEETHSGNPKPLYYQENKARFADFDITHVVIPKLATDATPWQREQWGRKCLLSHLAGVLPDETILISDVDEIPDLRSWNGKEGVFSHAVYCYYFNAFEGTGDWGGSFAIRRCNVDGRFVDARDRRKAKRFLPHVGNGWHFTSLGNEQDMIQKIESFAHQEFNTDYMKARIVAGRRKLATVNWLGRESAKLSVEDPTGPKWLLENRGKYPGLWVSA